MLGGSAPLLLVGAGKMGGAMLERWLEHGLKPADVIVVDPGIEEQRRAALAAAGVTILASAAEAGGRAYGLILLAVKPQSMAEALPKVEPLAAAGTTIVSIAAGVRLARLEAAFPAGQAIVRAMPNTPAQIGVGVSVALANAGVSDTQRRAVHELLAAIGKVAWIADEELMDAVTAVSGSGPAYVFLLAECLAAAGARAGLPDDLAALLARETVAGAGALMAASPLTPETLRQNVTSPGGTTAAALSVLMADDGLRPLLVRAVEAAKRRSVELGSS
jgi:pyrroline-5-carboxylate reductase